MRTDQEPFAGTGVRLDPDLVSEATEQRPPMGKMPSRASGAAPSSGWRQTFASLGNRDFRFLWAGTLFMMGGFQLGMIAQGFLVYEITGSAKILGLVSAGWAVPMLSLTLFGGALADRLERKPIIQAGQSTCAVVALAVAVLISTGLLEWPHLRGSSSFQCVVVPCAAPDRHATRPRT